MSGLLPTPTTIQAQINAINQNNFLTAAQKATQISALQAQLAALGSYTGNVSTNPASPAQINAIFAAQQALTQLLGQRAAQVTSTPGFVQQKATGGTLTDFNNLLTKQGVYVSTPELNAFNNAIQNVPLTPSDQQNLGSLVGRLQSPILTGQATSAADLYNFLVKSGALNPNPTPNIVTSVQSTPGAGGGYQPQSNLAQVQVPPSYIPAQIQQTPIIPAIPNIPQLPLTPPAGGGTSSGGSPGIVSLPNPNTSGGNPTLPSLPRIPLISDLGDLINGLLHTQFDPTLVGGITLLLGILIIISIIPRGQKHSPLPGIKLPKLTV